MSRTLTDEDLGAIEAIMRAIMKPSAPVTSARQWLPRRLTLPEFAGCIEVTPECARRYLRANKHSVVSKKLAMCDGLWKIDIAALELFGVSPALAMARLAAIRPADTVTPIFGPISD